MEHTAATRTSNIELLRIILILMVLTLHYFNADIGGLFAHVTTGSANYYIAHFWESVCIIAVNVFIVITGYFSCYKKEISLSKPLYLYSLLVFYGAIFSAVALYVKKPEINFLLLKQLINAVSYRWFVVFYCILYILIPFLNKLVHSLNRAQLRQLLLINALLFYAGSTFFPWHTITDYGYGIVNFVNLYLVGAYLRLYRPVALPKKRSFCIYLGCTLLTTAYSFVAGRAWYYSTIFNLVGAVAVFEFFRSIRLSYSPTINKLAGYTFGVYIIHCSGIFTGKFFFQYLFSEHLFYNSPWMMLHCIGTVLGLYIVCIAIEWVRRLLLGWLWDRQIEKLPYKIRCE